jgi:sarcinarray family protein
MDKKLIILGYFISFILLSTIGSASSPYLDLQVYYNDQLYPGDSTPKPLVKIGEPFTLKFDMTVNQECQVHVELADLGVYQGLESFVVVDGPSELGDSYSKVYEKNETFSYIWTLKPTEEWAGGNMPLDFHYEVQLKERYGSVVNSGFTAAYVTISSEYYEPSSATAKPGAQSPGDTTSPALPAFTLPAALAATCMAYVLRRR